MTSILLLTEAIYCNIFGCNYLRNEKYFLSFYSFFPFSKIRFNFEDFQKKMSLAVDVFLDLRSPKNVIRKMSKRSRFRGPFDKWHGKRAETLLKSERPHLYHIYWKTWLEKCLIGPISEDPSTNNMVNRPKHCWNLNDSTLTIFIDPCESNSGWKSLSELYTKP